MKTATYSGLTLNLGKQIYKRVFPARIKFLILAFFASLVLLPLVSCKVKLIADYDRHIHEQILTVTKDADLFYTRMLETKTDSTERGYNQFIDQYVEIEVELRSLKNINLTRSNNSNQDTISANVLNQWIKYKEQHKAENTLSNAKIILNREFMLAQLRALEVSERAKQLGLTSIERGQ